MNYRGRIDSMFFDPAAFESTFAARKQDSHREMERPISGNILQYRSAMLLRSKPANCGPHCCVPAQGILDSQLWTRRLVRAISEA